MPYNYITFKIPISVWNYRNLQLAALENNNVTDNISENIKEFPSLEKLYHNNI